MVGSHHYIGSALAYRPVLVATDLRTTVSKQAAKRPEVI